MKILCSFICLTLSFGATCHEIILDGESCFKLSSAVKEVDFHSQASQDAFVYTLLYQILDKKDKGYYLEIGSGYPIFWSNTFFFEKNFCWDGRSLDIVEPQPAWYSVRQNPLLIQDATTADYVSILSTFPEVVDYLSLDIDHDYDVVLNRIPMDKYIFKIITIEHDFYRFGDVYRQPEREILTNLGYYLLCPDVIDPAVGRFEDWWIHPSVFPPAVLSALSSLDLASKYYKDIVKIIQAELDNIK